jgi:excisionase family DNA binding protein
MSYTLAEAANATGVSKTTILKAIQGGKIIGTKDDRGKWHIEPAELHRLYPAVAERGARSQTARRSAAPDEANLGAQIEALIRRAGHLLQQQLDGEHRKSSSEVDQKQDLQSPLDEVKLETER